MLGKFERRKHGKEGARVKNMVAGWLAKAERELTTLDIPVTRAEMNLVVAWIIALEQEKDEKTNSTS